MEKSSLSKKPSCTLALSGALIAGFCLVLVWFNSSADEVQENGMEAIRGSVADVIVGGGSNVPLEFSHPTGDDNVEPAMPSGRKPTDQDYLTRYLRQVEYCGDLCKMDESKMLTPPISISVESLRKGYIAKSIRCDTFFSKRAESLFDGPPLEWPPPHDPIILSKFFVPGAHRQEGWFEQRYSGDKALVSEWTKEYIEGLVREAAAGTLKGSYSHSAVNAIKGPLLASNVNLKGMRVLVIGTEIPWVEAILLSLGAEEVTTLEYGVITSHHPKLKAVTPPQLNEIYRQGKFQQFDMAVSFSSLEHSGLGRYGDMLNPWGDVISTAKTSCMVKKGGYFLLGVPSAPTDAIMWNGARIYGPRRWPLVLQNWEAFGTIGGDEHGHATVLSRNMRED